MAWWCLGRKLPCCVVKCERRIYFFFRFCLVMKEESQPMRIHLAPHVLVETVGDKVVLLDTKTTTVYSLPAESVSLGDIGEQAFDVDQSAQAEVSKLRDLGVVLSDNSGVSRRSVVGIGGAAVGGLVLSMSLPLSAAASSSSNTDSTVFGEWGSTGKQLDGDGIELISIGVKVFFDPADFPTLVGAADTWTLIIFGSSFLLTNFDFGDNAVEFTFFSQESLEEVDKLLVGFSTAQGDLPGVMSDGTRSVPVVFVVPPYYSG